MNDKRLEQLSERVREAKSAVDEGDPKRGVTQMKQVLGEMARQGVCCTCEGRCPGIRFCMGVCGCWNGMTYGLCWRWRGMAA